MVKVNLGHGSSGGEDVGLHGHKLGIDSCDMCNQALDFGIEQTTIGNSTKHGVTLNGFTDALL